jgi:hypothetical protein
VKLFLLNFFVYYEAIKRDLFSSRFTRFVSQDRAKASQDQVKVAKKVDLETEKDNDAAQKEVQELGCNGPLKRMHTSDLTTTACVSLVILVMVQVVRSSSISIITGVRIIGAHASTIKTLFSSSFSGSTEWRRMRQD